MHKSLLKLVFNTILCASLMLGAATFTACQDYDDDIKNLEGKVTALETAVNDLKTQINNGKWITSVTTNTDGYTVALSDGTTLNIVNGTKGTTIEPKKETGTWWINGEDTNIPYECEEVNLPKMDDNGQLLIWDAANEKWLETGITAGGKTFVVKQEGYWELNVADKDGKMQVVKLPMSASLVDLKVYYYYAEDNYISGDDYEAGYIELAYGEKVTEDFEFNGKKYEEGNYLTHASAMVLLQANPTNVALENFNVALVDSKDNAAPVVLSKPYKHLTEKPYTRADKTENPGFYAVDFNLPANADLSDFEVEEEGDDLYDGTAYFVKAVDPASGNAMLSEGVVTVDFDYEESEVAEALEVTLKTNKEYTLVGEIGDLDMSEFNLVDYYFSMIEANTATFEKYGVKFDEATQTITAEKPCTVELYFNYLPLDGEVVEESAASKLTITFEDSEVIEAPKYVWTIQEDNAETTAAADATAQEVLAKNEQYVEAEVSEDFYNAVNDYLANLVVKYAEVPVVNGEEIEGIEAGKTEYTYTDQFTFHPFKVTDKKGYDSYYVGVEFANPAAATYYATTYNAEIKYLEDGVNYTYNFQIVINPANLEGFFQRKPAYFNGDNAFTYATALDGGVVKYNLTDLYDNGAEADFANVTFEEADLVIGQDDADEDILAPAWLKAAAGSIEVAAYNDVTIVGTEEVEVNTGVNSTRDFTATYLPFGNDNFDVITDEFTLKMRDKVYEGTFTVKTAPKAIEKEATTSAFAYAAMEVKDAFGKAPATDPVYTVEIDEAAKLYIKLSAPEASATVTPGTVTDGVGKLEKGQTIQFELLSPETLRQSDVTCNVKVTFTDEWNMTKEATTTVVLKANETQTTPATPAE